jgi:hypothetical protein
MKMENFIYETLKNWIMFRERNKWKLHMRKQSLPFHLPDLRLPPVGDGPAGVLVHPLTQPDHQLGYRLHSPQVITL